MSVHVFTWLDDDTLEISLVKYDSDGELLRYNEYIRF